MSEVLCLGQHENPVEAETGWLCYRCFTRLHRTIAELPAIVCWLEVNIATGGQGQTDRVSGSSDDPIPLRLDVLDLIGPYARDTGPAFTHNLDDQAGDPSIHNALVSWSKLLHDESGAAWPESNDVMGMTRYLLSALTWIASQPWVDEFMAEMLQLTRRAGRAAPWKPETRRVKDTACENCGVRALVTRVAEGVTRCEKGLGGCGHQREISDYAYRAYGVEAS